MKVLVSDPLSHVGIQLLEETPGIDVDVRTGLSPQDLKEIIHHYDGLVIRGATRVTKDILTSARNLRIIGRAGIGLDNIDIPEASRRGIVVMNTPEGNTITAAEHTIAMMMAASRNIPQATASMKSGKWNKKSFSGRSGIGNRGEPLRERDGCPWKASQAQRAKRTRGGLCRYCGDEAYGLSCCDRCRRRITNKQRAKRLRRKERNVCTDCKAPVKKGQYHCDDWCATYWRVC